MWEYRGQCRPPFADQPAPGQESVWDYPRPPRLVNDARRVVVKAGGRTVADTRSAVRVCETASPPTFYLPGADVDLDSLVEVEGRTICEWKGEARYFALRDASDRTVVAWDYPRPTRAFAALEGRIGFYPGRVECHADGERVRAQPGRFYAGWVTDDIAGPFKGEPGTEHW